MPHRPLLWALFCWVLILSCKHTYYVESVGGDNYSLEANTPEERGNLSSYLVSYRDSLEKSMDIVLGQLEVDLVKKKPESSLGNWLVDHIDHVGRSKYEQQVDFTALNYGGIRRNDLAQGPITQGEIFELLPFDNLLCLVNTKGHIVQKFFDLMAESYGWPVSKNVKYYIAEGKAEDIMINGQPLEPNRNYSILLPDYVANGGDKCSFFIDQQQDCSTYFLRDILIDHLAKDQLPQSAEITGRILIRE